MIQRWRLFPPQGNTAFFNPLTRCHALPDRSQALSLYHQHKQDAWNKRNKLTKLKGNLYASASVPVSTCCQLQ